MYLFGVEDIDKMVREMKLDIYVEKKVKDGLWLCLSTFPHLFQISITTSFTKVVDSPNELSNQETWNNKTD